jgi:hypothetical protein
VALALDAWRRVVVAWYNLDLGKGYKATTFNFARHRDGVEKCK